MRSFKIIFIGLCSLVVTLSFLAKGGYSEENGPFLKSVDVAIEKVPQTENHVALIPTLEGVDIEVTLDKKSDDTVIFISGEGGELIDTLHKGPLLPGKAVFSWRGKDKNGRPMKLTLPYAAHVQNEVLNLQEGFFPKVE